MTQELDKINNDFLPFYKKNYIDISMLLML